MLRLKFVLKHFSNEFQLHLRFIEPTVDRYMFVKTF